MSALSTLLAGAMPLTSREYVVEVVVRLSTLAVTPLEGGGGGKKGVVDHPLKILVLLLVSSLNPSFGL